ncbi:MAG: MFS transporter [Holophaga sp.]|nr:MFS transporter [Holophaga sp.]
MSDPRAKKALLCTITVFFWFAQYVYIPFLTPYLLTLAISATLVGVIIGAYGLTQLLLRIPLGITVDLIRNHKIVILAGVFLAGISSLGMLAFPSPGMLFLANALSGVASSTWISFTILYPAYYESGQGTRAIGIINAFQNTGILLAFVAGGLLFARFGMRALFVASFASGMAGSLLTLGIRHEPTARPANVSVASLLLVVKDRRVIFYSLLCSVTYLMLFATVFSFSTSTARELGATGPQIGAFAMLYSVGCIAGSFFIATSAARALGEKRLLSLAFTLLTLYCLCIPFVAGVRVFFPLHLVCGFGSGILTSSLMAFATRGVDPGRKTTAMGFYQSIYCIGMTAGPVIMGMLIDHSSRRVAFLAVAAIAFACALAVPVVYRSGYLDAKPLTD